MRIISGKWKGRSINVPEEGTRPSMDRTRQALFSILQNVIEGATVLDFYSGSGALALECLSRGAKRGVAIDSDRTAYRVIKENAKSLGCDSLTVLQRPVLDFMSKSAPTDTYSILFADPPYEKEFIGSQLHQLLTHSELIHFLSDDALFIAESPKELTEEEIKTLPPYWEVVSQRRYGKSHLTIFQRLSE